MRRRLHLPGLALRHIGTFFVLMAGGLLALAEIPPMDKSFVSTNGEWVTIGGIQVKNNSPLNTDYFKQFKWRCHVVMQIVGASSSNRTDRMAEGARALIKDYPNEPNGYQFMMMAMEHAELEGQPNKARALADELAGGTGPKEFQNWAKGFRNRLDAQGRPINMHFTAIDGRKVDLAQMRGKVVLVDFWGTHCGPCVAELPRVKAAFEKFHAQGLEVIGISCDTDQKELQDYVKKHGVSWPQYFDGKQQSKNRFTVSFGIDGIPHMFLVDKKGLLRFDYVRARDDVHRKGDTTSFEDKISKLLTER